MVHAHFLVSFPHTRRQPDHVPVVPGDVGRAVLERANAVHFCAKDWFLAKPLDYQLLLKTVRAALDM